MQTPALQHLYCQNNQLTLLEIANNTALSSILCSNNKLISLDASGCTALAGLFCYDNNLITLNATGCTELTEMYCYQNQINGENMNEFIESLPTTSNGRLEILYYDNEDNVMTTTQVAAAKSKGWIPWYSDGSGWKEYTGNDPSGIESIRNEQLENNAETIWYDLNGRRLTGEPALKGVYIMDGRKVIK